MRLLHRDASTFYEVALLYFVHTYFLGRRKNSGDSFGCTSIALRRCAFSSRCVPPAMNGQYEDRLRIASLGSAPAWSSRRLAPRVLAKEAAEEEEEETVEYHGGNSFVSFCPPTQRRATITVVAHRGLSALAIIDFYNFPCPLLSELPVPSLTRTSPETNIPLPRIFSWSFFSRISILRIYHSFKFFRGNVSVVNLSLTMIAHTLDIIFYIEILG